MRRWQRDGLRGIAAEAVAFHGTHISRDGGTRRRFVALYDLLTASSIGAGPERGLDGQFSRSCTVAAARRGMSRSFRLSHAPVPERAAVTPLMAGRLLCTATVPRGHDSSNDADHDKKTGGEPMLDFSTFKRRSSNGSSPHSGTADRSRPAASPYDFGAMELLVTRAERAAEQLRTLDTTIDRAAQFAALDERIARIEASLAQIEEVAKQAEAAQDVAAEFAASQEAVAERVAASGAEVNRIRTSCGELLTKVDAALEFRTELDDFLTLRPEFAALRLDADAITGRTRDLSDTIDRLRSVHDDAVQAHRHATSRLDGIDQRFQATASKLDSIERRASSSEQALTTLLNLARGVPE